MTYPWENDTTKITDIDWLDAKVCELGYKLMTLQDACQKVLCNPEGKACFKGSDADRKIIDDALELCRVEVTP